MIYDKVLLSSGGMDSFLLAHEPELAGAAHVYVDIGQKYARKEWDAAAYVADSCGAPLFPVAAFELAQFEHHPTGIIPFRNAELILCAAQYGNNIYLGVIADEVNSDKSPEFLAAMQQVLNISHRGQYWTKGREFQLLTPFRDISKAELVQRYLSNGGSLSVLLKSVSCYDGTDHHCGRCSSCFKRWVALTVATGEDYGDSHFLTHPGEYQGRAPTLQKLAGYPARRVAEVVKAFDIAGVK